MLDYANLRGDQTMFILVKAQPGVNIEDLRRRLQARLDGVDVVTRQQFSDMTANYWMFSTGAGITVIMAAVLGLLVGVVVVAQTIYAATIDHIREFGTLKAMGATNGYIYGVIMRQAAIGAAIGYGAGISRACGWFTRAATAAPTFNCPVTARRHVRCDRHHVYRRGHRLDQQGHQDRSGHGVQTITVDGRQ